MHACNSQYFANHHEESNMADWSIIDSDYNCFDFLPYYQEKDPNAPAQSVQESSSGPPPGMAQTHVSPTPPSHPPQGANPRELRNKAEKQRRDIMNQSIRRLATIVPTAASQDRKLNRTTVLRLAAHYLRSHEHVFGKSHNDGPQFSMKFTETLLKNLKGFLVTITYRGILVVVSPNIKEYLGYSELDLLGRNVSTIIHKEDCGILANQLFPRSCTLTTRGRILLPNDVEGEQKIADNLANEKRSFVIRFKKHSQYKSEAPQYVACHVEGCLRKSDRAGVRLEHATHVIRRARSRGNTVSECGNDVVFIGMVRPTVDTFKTQSTLESFKMEYRTRHSVDGEILQCEQRLSLVTGYMTHEVQGVNAMNFMHRDDVRYVVIALREMYDEHRLIGESCYRLITKNGQFIYMRTLGRLDVDHQSNSVTSFVCTNTVVDEQEGKHLIKLMKEKFMLRTNIPEELRNQEETSDEDLKHTLPVEDPTRLEKVILNLVTDLPSPSDSSSIHLAIIPPRKEKIQQAIKRSCQIIKSCCSTMAPPKAKNNTKSSASARARRAIPAIVQTYMESLSRASNSSTGATAGSYDMSMPAHSSAETPEDQIQHQDSNIYIMPSTFASNQRRPTPDYKTPPCTKTIKKNKIFKSRNCVKKYGHPKEIEDMLERELINNLRLMPFYLLPGDDNNFSTSYEIVFDVKRMDEIEQEDGVTSRNYNEDFNQVIDEFDVYYEPITEENVDSHNDDDLAVFDFTEN